MTTCGSARWENPRADPSRIRRVLGAGAAIGVAAILGAGLAGCANSAALGLVRQACQHVTMSIKFYDAARTAPDAQRAAHDREQAQDQLQIASPLAAEAAGQSPQWQALMATLAENSRLPEANLVSALQDQCASVYNGGAPVPTLPSTTLPAPPTSS
jgi:predicted nicotinamide N-methyase